MAEVMLKNEEAQSAISVLVNYIFKIERDLKDCRNELCLKCGDYKQRHLGVCDECRWRDANDTQTG